MSKYSELSDFEVNKLVAERLGLTVQYRAQIYDKPTVECCKNYNPDPLYYNRWMIKDWCNNWADAGQLMAENKISCVCERIGADKWQYRCTGLKAGVLSEAVSSSRPCRAIAECYLMKTESEE